VDDSWTHRSWRLQDANEGRTTFSKCVDSALKNDWRVDI
jgi:hypothetical protein